MPTLFKVLGHPGRFAPAASGNLTELWRLNLNRVLDSVAGHNTGFNTCNKTECMF